MEALKLKIEELNAEIEAFQAQLPEHGTQSIHRHGGAPRAKADPSPDPDPSVNISLRIQNQIYI